MKGFQRGVAGVAVVFVMGAGSLGCGGGGGGGGGLPPTTTTSTSPATASETNEVMKTSALVTTTAVLPFQVSLNEIAPSSFPTTQSTTGSLNTTATGDSAGGSIVFDFTGSGLSGQITANYTGGSSAGTVVMTFNNFGASSGADTLTIDGALTTAFSYSGGSATGTLTGSVTMTINGATTTVAINQTIDYDSALERFVISGTTTVTHSVHGTWTATYAGVTFDGTSAEITAGTVTLVQTNPAATAVYVFNGTGGASFTITPVGVSGSFQL